MKHVSSLRKLREDAGSNALAVFVALVEMAAEAGNEVITPTRDDIAHATGIDRPSTISKCLAKLHEAGWIEKHNKTFIGPAGARTVIWVRVERPLYQKMIHGGDQKMIHYARKIAPKAAHSGSKNDLPRRSKNDPRLPLSEGGGGRLTPAAPPSGGGPATSTPKTPKHPTPPPTPEPEEPLCIGLSPIVLKFQEAQKRAQEAQGSTQGGGGV